MSSPLPGVHVQTMNKVVFIREAVSEDVANNMIALTLYLDSLDKKRIYYWLNCPGGDVSGADVMFVLAEKWILLDARCRQHMRHFSCCEPCCLCLG